VLDAQSSAAAFDQSVKAGYTEADLSDVTDGANLGAGCGNPLSFAALKEGEKVADLGSGAGIDCLLAAKAVGPRGSVIGVDMSHDMLDRARAVADERGATNVSFRTYLEAHFSLSFLCSWAPPDRRCPLVRVSFVPIVPIIARLALLPKNIGIQTAAFRDSFQSPTKAPSYDGDLIDGTLPTSPLPLTLALTFT
jgi:SAM-dependent methyltransferase